MSATTPGTAKGDAESLEPTKAQQAFARRVAESRATVPDVTAHRRAAAPAGDLLPALISAVARALRAAPEVNAAYRDAKFERFSRVNVGVAVEAEGTIVVPTLFDADTKDAEALTSELAGLRTAAEQGAITAPALAGGTFTIWQTDDVDRLVPPLVAPQAANLGAGGVRDGQVELTLVADARILNPFAVARFLARVADELAG